MTAPRHLSELEVARSLVPGARRPACSVPGCAACAARLDEAQRAAREFQTTVLPGTLPRLRARAAGRSRRRWASWVRGLAAPALAAAAAVIALALWPRAAGGPASSYVAAKGGGGGEVRMFVRRDGVVRELADGGRVAPGDAIRFVVEPRGARYVLVISVDGARDVHVYYPFDGAMSAALPAGAARVELDGSVELDDVLGDERIWVVLSASPLAVVPDDARRVRVIGPGIAAVIDASAPDAPDELPGARAVVWRLHKQPPADPPGRAPAASVQ